MYFTLSKYPVNAKVKNKFYRHDKALFHPTIERLNDFKYIYATSVLNINF